jgi:hypothetical protein
MHLRPIEIDMDVHKAIEARRESFRESPNDILRRALLGSTSASKILTEPKAPHGKNGAWIYIRSGKEASLPSGTELRGSYSGQMKFGRVEKGKLVVDGRSFDSPSEAAITLFRTKEGQQTNLNGWTIWEYRVSGDQVWHSFKSLRTSE